MNVYDFDNTIYDGESCLDFFFWLMKKDRSLLKFMPKMLFAFAKYKRGKVTVQEVFDKYAPYVQRYIRKNPEIFSDTSEFWDSHIKNIKPFYSVLHKPDDLIITASPEATVREICSRLGISNYICSLIDEETGRITRMCMRNEKVKAFFEEYPGQKIECFYTDSPKNDMPLIEISEHAFIVKGNKIIKFK